MRVTQSTVQSPRHDADATFTLNNWVGTIGGSALGVDPNPNTTPPQPGRILMVSPKKDALAPIGLGSLRIIAAIVAASSITVQPWFFDNAQNLWIQYGPPITLTPTGAATNVSATVLGMLGAKFFVQITANTLVQALGYDYF